MTGYEHPRYACALKEFGTPRNLPHCGGSFLERRISAVNQTDGMGCYPLFCCLNWQGLAEDLRSLQDRLVSFALVADPFGGYTPQQLAAWFDVVLPFKSHYLVDLEMRSCSPSKHHRYYARRALAALRMEAGAAPAGFAMEWSALYQNLSARHGIHGIQAFSLASFETQLSVPGLVALRAFEGDSLVGAHLWYVQGEVAYSHLAAASSRGYELNCLYATYAFAFEYFRGLVRWLDLGAGAGVQQTKAGLTQFKAGWATGTRPVYFCGRILNRGIYEELRSRTANWNGVYFPAYRQGEFE
jgi:hypothetical protein